jgi:hypothetical protein
MEMVYVLSHPNATNIMKCAIPVTVEEIIREYTMSENTMLYPGKRTLEIAYAAIEPITRHPTVAPREMKIVLKMYLESGTQVEVIEAKRSMKF